MGAALAAGAHAPVALAASPLLSSNVANPFTGPAPLAAAAAAAPADFQESTVWSGLTNPMAIRFAADGRVFVAEKSGRILVYDDLSDPTPTVFADLSSRVHDFWDRGFEGMALDPGFTTGRPFVYALYAYDKDPSSATTPRWGDDCSTPPGPTDDGCVISGRLSRLNAAGTEQVLIEDWCQQYPSHSLGSLAFGADGALYVSGGDGASFNFTDYGQDGNPVNPCGDPPGGRGGSMTPPTAEGGALRSQDSRTTGDPTGLDGTILRVNPDTGAAMPDNPNAASSDPNARRIVANGLRNPFRITVRPGTNEIWAGDVGWNTWEEIDRLQTPTAGVKNFGWPCYEGDGRQGGYDSLDLNLCESLYSQGDSAVSSPYYTYNHGEQVVSGESCPTGGSSISGLAFYDKTAFPARYRNALFFADYTRNCIWVMLPGANGLPDPAQRETFVAGAAGPVDLQVGPNGDLYYADLNGGTIRRIRYLFSNRTPTAVASATPTDGAAPLDVSFDGTGSSDPDGDTLAYAWDLDGDGAYDDSTASRPTFRYTAAGTYSVRLRVTDPSGLVDTDTLTITAGTPPTATIATPTAGTLWKVGDTVSFSGSATDFQGSAVPASGLTWELVLHHCNRTGDSCHTHELKTYPGAASGSFSAPDHEYPSYIELRMTATDSRGLMTTVSRRIDPRTVRLTVESSPAGLQASLGSETVATPFTREVIVGSSNSLAMSSPQSIGSTSYDFTSWSDGGARAHNLVAPATDTTYRATFTQGGAVSRIAGSDVVGSSVSEALPGGAEVYRTTATAAGRATALRLHLAPNSTASALVLGMYSDSGGEPAFLLGSGRISAPVAGQWAEVPLANGPQLVAGQAYWISLLNPSDATGTLRWHDRAGGGGGAERTSANNPHASFPGAWTTAASWSDGPVSGYVMGTSAPPPAPSLSVTPASLSFSATQGGASPAAKTLSVANTGGGTLSFTDSDDAAWLTVTPASATAPRDLSVAVNTAGLTQGTYTATVRVESTGTSGSPKLIPVTLTVGPPAAVPVLNTSPASLTFGGVAGGANPAAQNVSVTNTGGGTLSYTATDNQTWITESPTSGTAPGTVAVSVSSAGLAAGTYTGTVQVASAGATGSPKSIPVTLNLSQPPPPTGGLVGSWSFDEASGGTVQDASGRGNPGTISGAARVAGRFGGGLSFNGVNDWVTVADSASLHLTTAMTIEAWVRPTALSTMWRTVAIKERLPGELAYALYANTDTTRPSGHVSTSQEYGLRGPAALTIGSWTHLATTWDGTTLRLFVNGTQVANALVTGTALSSTNPLRFGGNSIWSEWFAGVIDEMRLYSRALSATEIQSDSTTPITAGATVARRASAAASHRSTAQRRKAGARARKLARWRALPAPSWHEPRWLKNRLRHAKLAARCAADRGRWAHAHGSRSAVPRCTRARRH